MSDCCEVNEKYYRYTIDQPTAQDLLLESLCIPTQTEIRNQLGSKLADVFFENLSSEGRVILGLQPPLTGPDEVWINPDLRLKNKVRCKPVPEPQVLHQKAFTHHMILELGQKYIESLELKMRQEIEESLKNQEAELEEECNKRLIEALENAKAEADEHCKQVVGTLMDHFDRCFSEITDKYKLRMRKECQFRVQEERAELAAYMLAQLQEEVEKRDLELCSDFHDTLDGELSALASKYVKQIDCERKAAQEVLQEVIEKYETMLVDLRSEMEIFSFVDVCRAITEEKAKHEREAKGAEEEMRNQARSLMKWIVALKDRNAKLQEMVAERAKRIKQYEKTTKILTAEFQRFINFALKAAPAHAEFLLSEQRTAIRKHREDASLRSVDYENFRERLLGELSAGEEEPAGSSSENETVSGASAEKEEKEDTEAKCGDSKYTFNYYRFKYGLLKNLIKGIKFDSKPEKLLPEKKVCAKKESEILEEDEISDEYLEERKQSLKLVGEREREHMQPVKTFLTERVKHLARLCKNDPEMVRIILGSRDDGK